MFLKCLGSCSSKPTSSSQTQRQYPTVIEELCHQFSLADLRKSTNNFDENRVIGVGVGGFVKVYHGVLQYNDASDHAVAIKRFNVESHQGIEEFKNEIELLCQLRHPNLVSIIGFCNHKTERILVYEYMSNGSLGDHLRRRRGDMEALSWKKRLEICIGAARGLHYLHTGARHTILHRDIKPRSVLLDHNMEPKLAGFGYSVQGPHSMSKPKPIIVDIAGTRGYVAMEGLTGGPITVKSDVYSFGITLLDVVLGSWLRTVIELLEEKPIEEFIDQTIQGNIAPECWKLYRDIIQRCIKNEPEERPTMGEVEVQLEHALLLQEQADIRNNNGDYTLFSTTIINWHGTGNLNPRHNNFILTDTEDSEAEDSDQY